MQRTVDVAGVLRGQRIFVTGATGFLGKVVVEKLLWSVPDVGRLLLLVRPGGERSAAQRLRDEVLAAPPMARLRARHGERWESWAEQAVEVVAGDLARPRFGLDPGAWSDLCRRVDRVVAAAATVTFDERLDRALEINARGALRTLELAREAGGVPLLQVSTCFVSGRRRGWVDERPVELDADAVLVELDAACGELRSADADAAAFVAAGARQAARRGFHDVYTLTKALGEALVVRRRGAVPVSVVRPAIVVGALREPTPGWLEAVRVVDPLLVAYGRGLTRELPGAAQAPLELVPVDCVANAVLAALADLPAAGTAADVRLLQVGSSRHPITLGELVRSAREGFAATPLRDPEGEPIAVPEARFVDPQRLRRRLARRLGRVRRLCRLLSRLGVSRFAARQGAARRRLEHFHRLVEVYQPYVRHAARYRDDATHDLWRRLSPASRTAFPFDVGKIDWARYVSRVHVPGLVRFALRAESGVPSPPRPPVPLATAVARTAGAKSLFSLFAAVAAAHPDTVAVQTYRHGRWLRYTYGQALDATANVAWRLRERYGIGRGDRVALWAGGSPEWVLTALAAHRLGAAVVPLDPQWPADEVARAARLVDARLICVGPGREPVPDLGEVPVADLAAPFVPEPEVGLLPEARSTAAADETGEDDLASVLFTSGTTVAPKAVPLTTATTWPTSATWCR